MQAERATLTAPGSESPADHAPTLPRLGILVGCIALLLLLGGSGAARADASPRVKLKTFCAVAGEAAGQCRTPTGVAVNRSGAGGVDPGTVYVADSGNNRVVVFAADGTFLRAFGKDVNAAGGDLCLAADTCRAGAATAVAGAIRTPQGLDVDQDTGSVYLTSSANRRIDVFSATGSFEAAFGWNVKEGSAVEALELCTALSGCQAGATATAITPKAGALGILTNAAPAVDQTSGAVYVPDQGNQRINEFLPSYGPGGGIVAVDFVRAIGAGVNASAPSSSLQACTTASGCQKGASTGLGSFLPGSPTQIAVAADGDIFAVDKRAATCTPCHVYRISADLSAVEDFAPQHLTFATGSATTQAAYAVAVVPDSGDLLVVRKTPQGEAQLLQLSSDGELNSTSPPAGALAATGAQIGMALGLGNRAYVSSVSAAPQGQVFLLGDAPPPTVQMGTVSDVGPRGARLTGTATPPAELEGQSFAATWHFEYSTDQAHWTSAPVPSRALATGPGQPEAVQQLVSGLLPNRTYFARICATTGPTVCSSPAREFKTGSVPPSIDATYSADVTRTEATLTASVVPNGLATAYHFEWATAEEWEAEPGSFGHRIPAKDRQVGAGSEPVSVHEDLAGLTPGRVVHFRVVATNASGQATGPEMELETLNACGLPGGRCFELTSPPAKGVDGEAGRYAILGANLQFQPLPDGPGIAYTMANGLPNATAGGEVAYRALRGDGEWSSAQLSPPALDRLEVGFEASQSQLSALAADLSCGVLASPSTLADGTPAAPVEAGGSNLYRWRDEGGYVPITATAPVNVDSAGVGGSGGLLGPAEYAVLGMSADCARVVFRTPYHYPGVPGAGGYRTYEWAGGQLRDLAEVPGPGGLEAAAAVAGAWVGGATPDAGYSGSGGFNHVGAVSPDARSVVLSAARRASSLSSELGRPAVFLRSGPGAVLDVSSSETAVPNDGRSLYQLATWQGGTRVFFTARYGLAGNGSSTGSSSCENLEAGLGATGIGCDLYEFDLAKQAAGEPALTDLSPLAADPGNPKGASVSGVLGASADGSHVYFAAKGRVGSAGASYVDNQAAGTYNVYLSRLEVETGERSVEYVGRVLSDEAVVSNTRGEALVGSAGSRFSQVSPDGRHLLFVSRAEVTGYRSGGPAMVYLYSAGTAQTVCLSCPRDGTPSGSLTSNRPLPSKNSGSGLYSRSALSANGEAAFFLSEDVLASGAMAGVKNLYEWRRRGQAGDGQVVLLASEAAGLTPPTIERNSHGLVFGGASADAADVYLATNERLTWQDVDNHYDVYDARRGGGFPAPLPAPQPCDPSSEGSCQRPAAPAPIGLGLGSAWFSGPGNPVPQAGPKTSGKKQAKKRRGKRKQKATGKHRRGGEPRRSNGDRRAGK